MRLRFIEGGGLCVCQSKISTNEMDVNRIDKKQREQPQERRMVVRSGLVGNWNSGLVTEVDI